MKMKRSRYGVLLAVALAASGWLAHADIVEDIASLVPAQPHSYAETMTLLKELCKSPRIQATSLGSTCKGRTIALAVARDPQVSLRSSRKLMIIARQHGNEPSGTEAVLALLRHLAATERQPELELLKRVTLVTIPMANPDGASASSRRNAAGVDLNRDWIALSQAESQAIERAYLQWRPDAVMDLHELPAQSAKASYQENFVETVGTAATLPASLSRTAGEVSARISAWMGRYGIPLNVYYDVPGDDLRLCHRHFGLYHQVPSYLFESKTGRGRSLRDRARYHILGMLVVASHLAYHDQVTEPIQIAMQPTVPPAPAPAPRAEPKITELQMLEPVADQAREGRALVRADVTPGDDFAYLTFELNGAVVALTNRAPYEYSLDISRCADGAQEIAVCCYDASGRCLARHRRTVTVHQATLLMGE
jgi:hypothetical protein